MNQEILNLIEMAIADGDISEKERSIILRKAEKVGEDKDEVEMVLEGKLAMMKKQERPAVEKAGNVIKCPQCKADVPSFTTKCEFCDHEFRNIEAVSSVNIFFERIEQLESKRSNDTMGGMLGGLGKMMSGNHLVADSIAKQKAELVKSFPVPNSKEDILEFLSIATPRAKQSNKSVFGKVFSGKGVDASVELVNDAFKEKCEQIIMKAGFSFKNDPKTMEEIRYYAKELKIKMK